MKIIRHYARLARFLTYHQMYDPRQINFRVNWHNLASMARHPILEIAARQDGDRP